MKPSRLKNLFRVVFIACWFASLAPSARAQTDGQTFRLYEGVTVYINNDRGSDFGINLDVRDLNLFSGGPREVLFKVYDPDGRPVVREIIDDDGVQSANFPDRIGGWDHELQYYADLYAKGTSPSFRWSAWSDPARLNSVVKRTFKKSIKGGKKGLYRVVLAGTPDHYVTLALTPQLSFGVAGHPTFLHGHHDQYKKSYLYVPKGTSGLFFAAAEPDFPRGRRFKITAPDGKVLLDQDAGGGFAQAMIDDVSAYTGQLLTLDISSGTGDYLVKVTFPQPKTGAFADYVGVGSNAVFAPDVKTAMALQGGTTVVDDQLFWHPFQIRFYDWLKANKLDDSAAHKAVRTDAEQMFNGFRLLETGDERGSATWTNLSYAMGYYGFKIFRPAWLLMKNPDAPPELKNLVKEGLIMAGDRLSFATGIERVNGNAFAQIPVALWYCSQATGDAMQKARFEVFFDRWQHEGWGAGVGLSKSGDAQEHFAHDCHYGSYIMDNWSGRATWVSHGIVEDAKDDPRFAKVLNRIRDLYSYLYCRDATAEGAPPVPANPWSSRTSMHPHLEEKNWEVDGRKWKGEPGPDFTTSVNGGNEWFAARRKNYYALTFHGRLAPEWMNQTFQGQLGFGGGILCQLTVPGKGPVLASTLRGSYGEGMHPSNWRNFHIHSVVGELWDGQPLIAAISEHDDARLNGSTVQSSGEVRGARVKAIRRYTYNADSIDCEVNLAPSDYQQVLSLWSHGRLWSEVKVAYEMLPFQMDRDGKPLAKVTLKDAAGKDLGELTAQPQEAQAVRIDRGGFGVDVQLEKPMKVSRGATNTVLIQLTPEGAKPTPAGDVHLKYRLTPYGN